VINGPAGPGYGLKSRREYEFRRRLDRAIHEFKPALHEIRTEFEAITAQTHPNGRRRWLAIMSKHLLTLDNLIANEHGRDPFDHLLIAQAVAEGMSFVTGDGHARQYPVAVLAS
jgi:PIN domain nuclease of toxin-antitoxin system